MTRKYKNCKVDIVAISLKFLDETKQISFEDILNHPEILNQEKYINFKSVHYSILEQNENYIVGLIRTTLDKDLPAKIDKKTKEISAIDVKPSEGLAYGNVFLYSKELKTLFYEVNKNSIYVDAFREFIIKCYLDSDFLKTETSFDVIISTIYRQKEYERALKMDVYKSFKMKVHQPRKLLEEMIKLNSSLDTKINLEFLPEIEKGAELNSDFAEIEFNVRNAKKYGGLYKDKIEPIIKDFGKLLGYGQIRENIDLVEICGYTLDTSNAKTPIDLLGDVYFSKFKLEVPRLDTDLQRDDRLQCIKDVFTKEYPILIKYI
jgi:hypothetical protein